jgi:hypothetical protein
MKIKSEEMRINRAWLKNLKNMAKKWGVEEDTIDWVHEIDWSLSYDEIKNSFIQLLAIKGGKNPDGDVKTEKVEYFNMLEEELRKRIENDMELLKETQDVDIFYQDMYKMLEVFHNSTHFNLLIISGRAGIGKSFSIMKWCVRNNITPHKYNGHITPYQLFHILYKHDKDLIIFDDSNPILENVSSVSLLLQACETMPTRVISWNTSKPMDIPERFSFDGKIIILTNKTFDEIDEALQSRALKYTLEFSNETMLKIINSICKLEEKNMILELLRKNFFDIEINLRVYKMLETLLLFLKSQNKLESFEKMGEIIIKMESNPNLKTAYEVLKTVCDLNKAVKVFMEKTGLKRTSFYYYKKKIGNLYEIV